jgi:hypothetical protein
MSSPWTAVSPTSSSRRSDSLPRLAGEVVPVGTLAASDREAMRRLLDRYFEGVSGARFEADLAEKEWAILLHDATGALRGFSTLMRLRPRVPEGPVVAFYSGDTIIEREFWGDDALPRLWGRHVFTLAAAEPDVPAYWFLICSGYKTYRFLPVFYREFFPTWRRATPPNVRRLLDALAGAKFGPAYDAERGVVRLPGATPLRAGVGDVTPRRLRDPDVAFFAAANPGHARGDELACLVRIAPDNVTRAGRRMLGWPADG